MEEATASKKQRVATADTDMVDIVGKECEEEKKEEEQGTKQDEAKMVDLVDVGVSSSSKKEDGMETVHSKDEDVSKEPPPTSGEFFETLENAVKTFFAVSQFAHSDGRWLVPDNDESRELASLIMKIQGPFCIKYSVPPSEFSKEIIINIDGEPVGTLFNPDVDKIISKATVAPFGRGSETIVDPSVRNALEITADRLSTTIEVKEKKDRYSYSYDREKKSDHDFVFNPLRWFERAHYLAPRNLFLEAEPYKLHIYPKGGKFEPHVDTSHGEGHHATLVAILPTEYEGGELVVEHGGKEAVIGGKEEEEEKENKEEEEGGDEKKKAIKMGCFYTDCTHRVLPVTSGTRIALQYDLFLTDESEENRDGYNYTFDYENHPERVFDSLSDKAFPERGDMASRLADDPAFVDSFIAAVDKLMKKHPRMNLAILLRHRYPAHSLATSMLRGGDQGLYDVLKRVCSSRMTDEPIVAPIVICYEDYRNNNLTLRASPIKPTVFDKKFSSTSFAKIAQEEAICVLGSLGDKLSRLYHRKYLEETGNEAQPESGTYLSAALVIRALK